MVRASKSERFAAQVGDALAQSIVGAFDNRGLAERILVALDAATVFVRCVLEQSLIHPQTIGEHKPVPPGRGDLLPQGSGTFQVAFADMEGNHLQVAPGEDQPYPRLIGFGTHKGPQLIDDRFIPTAGGDTLAQRRQRLYFFLSRAYTVLGLTLNVRQILIKAVFSAKAFKIICSFSGVSERDLGEGAHARRHTLQYKRSLPC